MSLSQDIMNSGLRDWANRSPERILVRFPGGPDWTYGQIEALANKFARLYQASGLKTGDHVAGIFANDPYMLAAVWGAYRAGVYFTPVANTFSSLEIAYVVSNCQATIIIADARFAPNVADLPDMIPSARQFFAHGGTLEGYETLDQALDAVSERPLDNEVPGAMMLYSSGTTGAPKGIFRPLRTATEIGKGPPPFARDLLKIFGIDADTRYLSPAPLYHASPLRFTLAVSAAGGTTVMMRKFDAAEALDLLESESITMSQWVPTMFQRMLALPDERRSAFRAPAHAMAIHAAAPCSPPVKRAMIDWWGPILREHYAGTESIGLATISSYEWLQRPGSVGKVVKGVAHILDSSGQELPVGQRGGIYFSGTSQFEYFGDPEKTRERTSPQGYQTFGDIGWLDEDGYLFLSDRMDDMIISGGVNLYPQEIELAIEEAPGVAECGVIGVPDDDFGERPVAFVVRERDDSALADPDFLAALVAFARKRLGKTKQLKAFHILEKLPRGPTGKLHRRMLRDQLRSGRSSETAEDSSASTPA
ncbi:AMP-binding protein [Aquamicrobium sp.]|uniref:AMP-binding protein n=1 Tax=Aquamicrobium sp. TaxID=1872579 RepID=UPI00258F4E01|nr:AMP-binding protein [Aquamicrobium sp.]MCK9553225.1 AMP-binding protein [Aquamicrobium sp.]